MKEIRISVPEGVSEFSVQVNKDGIATVLYDTPVKEWEPEDGDILTEMMSGNVVIYAGTTHSGAIISYTGYNEMSKLTTSKGTGWGHTKDFRPATEEEKQGLFKVLAGVGLRWNAKKKELENIPRWKAEKGRSYFCIQGNLSILENTEEDDVYDNGYYKIGNYFKTWEAAEKAAEQIREIFKNSEAE